VKLSHWIHHNVSTGDANFRTARASQEEQPVGDNSSSGTSKIGLRERSAADFFAIQCVVTLFNTIAVPCLMVGVISPNCYYHLFVAAPDVSSTYTFQRCASFYPFIGCANYDSVTAVSAYSPPFTYSYECSAGLITYYAPTFVYLGLIVSVASPLWEFIAYTLFRRCERQTWWHRNLRQLVPKLLHDPVSDEKDYGTEYSIYRPYFDGNIMFLTLVSYLAILLTFGLVFPPVAVVMLISMYTVVFLVRIHVGRFLTVAMAENGHVYADVVDRECEGVASVPMLRRSARLLILCMCLFYTAVLFDTLGDAVGAKGAIWVVVLVPVLPFALYAAVTLARPVSLKGPQKDETREKAVVEVEMGAVRMSAVGELQSEGGESAQGNGTGPAVLSALHS
jgi:hypothetical protein